MVSQKEKVAILLTALGPSLSSAIIKHLDPARAAEMLDVMKKVEGIAPSTKQMIIGEFFRKGAAARGQIRQAAGSLPTEPQKPQKPKRAGYVVPGEEEDDGEDVDVLEFIQNADHAQLFELIKNEHPQVVSFILAYIPPEVSSQIMPLFSEEMQRDVAFRIATMQVPQRDMIKHLNKILGNKIKLLTKKALTVGGVETLIKIMKGAGRATERIIIDTFQKDNPEIAEEIKKRTLVFEDLTLLDSSNMQKILRDIDTKILALALKKTSDEIKDLIMRNISERARGMLEEDIAAMGKVPLKEVEKAQQDIIEIVRQLEEKGEIQIKREEEELI